MDSDLKTSLKDVSISSFLKTPNWIALRPNVCSHVVQLAQRKIQEILAQVRRQQQPKPTSGAPPPQPRRK